ncbi:MAG: response regulator [Anaerolinea sp.]|nr:response regulator [Anaerolinea sp.]
MNLPVNWGTCIVEHTILVVDDEQEVRTLLTLVLKRAGFRVLTSENGEEALAVMEANPYPNLVITDVMMPRMDGLSLCREVRSRAHLADTPLMVISALRDSKTIEQCDALRVNRFLAKPIKHTELISEVRSLLGAVS